MEYLGNVFSANDLYLFEEHIDEHPKRQVILYTLLYEDTDKPVN